MLTLTSICFIDDDDHLLTSGEIQCDIYWLVPAMITCYTITSHFRLTLHGKFIYSWYYEAIMQIYIQS